MWVIPEVTSWPICAGARFSSNGLGGLGRWQVLSGHWSSPASWFQVLFAPSHEESRKKSLGNTVRQRVVSVSRWVAKARAWDGADDRSRFPDHPDLGWASWGDKDLILKSLLGE